MPFVCINSPAHSVVRPCSSFAAGLKWSFMQVSHGGSYTHYQIFPLTLMQRRPQHHTTQRSHTRTLSHRYAPEYIHFQTSWISSETQDVHGRPLIGHRCARLYDSNPPPVVRRLQLQIWIHISLSVLFTPPCLEHNFELWTVQILNWISLVRVWQRCTVSKTRSTRQ